MGIYRRRDSKFWWMIIEGLGYRRSTGIPVEGGSPAQNKELQRQAQTIYAARMGLDYTRKARTELAAANSSRTPTTLASLPRSVAGWCYVYFVQVGDLVKIGRAIDMARRLEKLQTDSGVPLQVLAIVPAHADLEPAIHVRFAHLRTRGEWFQLDPDLRMFIERVRQGINPVALLWGQEPEPKPEA